LDEGLLVLLSLEVTHFDLRYVAGRHNTGCKEFDHKFFFNV